MAENSSPESEHYLERELRERFRTDPEIFDFLEQGAWDGIWYWDVEQPEREWMSPRLKQVFGYEEHEIPNTSRWWREHIFGEDLDLVLRNFKAHCEDPNHPYDQTVRYRHKDGSTVWMRCRGIASRNAAGQPVRMLGVHQNVTKLKTIQARLEEQSADLTATNQELDSFAYAASHDLREPLRTLVCYSSLLRQDLGEEISEDAAQDLEFIGRAAHRMDRLINDLLSLSRAGRKPIRVEKLDLQDCLQDALDALSAALSETRAEVRRDDLPMVVGDRTLITQVYQNLIANSLKFAPPGARPRLRATAEMVAGNWEFGVRDNGIGIDPDHAERVFQPFERLHGLSEYDGSGLGLAICRRAIERLGGRIWVAPESCQGAHVKFTLPLQREANRV